MIKLIRLGCSLRWRGSSRATMCGSNSTWHSASVVFTSPVPTSPSAPDVPSSRRRSFGWYAHTWPFFGSPHLEHL